MNQSRDMNLIKMKKEGEEVLKEFKSIVKKKLKQPLDLKKIYYEQMEHLPYSRYVPASTAYNTSLCKERD